MTVSSRVAEHARGRPDALAVAIGSERTTFGRLARRAAQIAAGLSALPRRTAPCCPGLPEDGRLLAVAVGNDPQFPELFVGGTAGAHACAVLDPKWAPAQAVSILPRLQPDLLVIGDGTASAQPALLSAAREHGIPVLTAAAESYEPWLAQYDGADPDRHLAPPREGETFLVGFTSGTTSLPKAFHRARASWRASLAAGRGVFALDPSTSMLAPGPLAHGLTLYALAEALDVGAPFHGLPTFDGRAAAAAIRGEGIRRLVVVPTMLAALCEAARSAGDIFPTVRSIVTAGAKLDARLAEETQAILPNARIVEYYGASELGFVTVTQRRPGDAPGDDVGHPFPGIEIAIRDADGRPAEDGRPGAVFVRSPLVSSGYLWGAEDGSGFRTDGAGWATVGDIGWLDETGALHLAGREGEMVITGGLNVYPAEVEQVLRGLPGIEQAVVLGVPDDYLGRRLVAVLSGPGVAGLTQRQAAELCLPHLPRYKIPRQLFAVAASGWPMTRSGKVARKEIAEWIADEHERRPSLVKLPP
jgi:acyl-CoA synthetase (AMP-forming)/AMP-acid ligase II